MCQDDLFLGPKESNLKSFSLYVIVSANLIELKPLMLKMIKKAEAMHFLSPMYSTPWLVLIKILHHALSSSGFHHHLFQFSLPHSNSRILQI